MGYCLLCHQHLESPYDCDCREPEEEPGTGHDWSAIEAGGLMRDWDDWENAGRFAECNNCGRVTSEPRKITEPCPA